MVKKERGFIPEYRDFVLDHIPTSVDWAESIAISLLSTAVGGNMFVRSKIGHLKLNLWFLMIGPSGIAYKSTPLNYFVFPVLKQLTQEVGETTIMPSRFSIEGIIEWLTNHPHGCIVRDEFTTVFKETSKGYLSDILEFMSELYDGRMQKRFTRKTKLEEATDVYVTFLAATTPYIYRVMKPSFFVQGTGNRILPVMYGGLIEETLDHDPEDFFYDIKQDALRKERLIKYAKLLGKVRKSPVEQLVPIQEAGKMWLNFRKGITLKANKMYQDDVYNLKYTYITRLGEFTLKLSALHALSTYYKSLDKYEREMPILEEDMKWAIGRVRKYFSHFENLLDNWKPEEEAQPKDLTDSINRVYNYLYHYKQGVKWRDFNMRFKWDMGFLKSTLFSLHQQEKIGFARDMNTGGRPAVMLYVKEHKTEIDKLGYEPLMWQLFTEFAHIDKVGMRV